MKHYKIKAQPKWLIYNSGSIRNCMMSQQLKEKRATFDATCTQVSMFVCMLEREGGLCTFATVRTDGRMDRPANNWKGDAVARVLGRVKDGMGDSVGAVGGTTTAELSFLVRVYFSRDYKRS